MFVILSVVDVGGLLVVTVGVTLIGLVVLIGSWVVVVVFEDGCVVSVGGRVVIVGVDGRVGLVGLVVVGVIVVVVVVVVVLFVVERSHATNSSPS